MDMLHFLKLGVRVFGGRSGQGKPYGRGDTHPVLGHDFSHKRVETLVQPGGIPPLTSEQKDLSPIRALYSFYALEGRDKVTLIIQPFKNT